MHATIYAGGQQKSQRKTSGQDDRATQYATPQYPQHNPEPGKCVRIIDIEIMYIGQTGKFPIVKN